MRFCKSCHRQTGPLIGAKLPQVNHIPGTNCEYKKKQEGYGWLDPKTETYVAKKPRQEPQLSYEEQRALVLERARQRKDYKNFSESLGRTIRLNRELRDITLSDMAKHQGLTVSGWSRVETGVTEVRATQLAKAAERFNTPAWLLVKQAEQTLEATVDTKGAAR